MKTRVQRGSRLWVVLLAAALSLSALGAAQADRDWVSVTVTGSATAPMCVRAVVEATVPPSASNAPHYIATGARVGHSPLVAAATHLASRSSAWVLVDDASVEVALTEYSEVSGKLSMEFVIECIPPRQSATMFLFVTGPAMGGRPHVSVVGSDGESLPRDTVRIRTGSGSTALVAERAGDDGAALGVAGNAAGVAGFRVRSDRPSLLLMLTGECGTGCVYEWRRPDGVSGASELEAADVLPVVGPPGEWTLDVAGVRVGRDDPWAGRGNGAVALFAPIGVLHK
jgi:hypothetical protein